MTRRRAKKILTHMGRLAYSDEQLARAGEIRAVGVASVHVGRCDATTYTVGDADVAHLHLAAHTLLRRILDENER